LPRKLPRVLALAGLSTMIDVLTLFSSQIIDGSPCLCDKDKPRATNSTLHLKPLGSIIESQKENPIVSSDMELIHGNE
jgi:hypothetical protein